MDEGTKSRCEAVILRINQDDTVDLRFEGWKQGREETVTIRDLQERSQPEVDYPETLRLFFRRINPAKVKNVSALLGRYVGKEEELIQKMEEKYKQHVPRVRVGDLDFKF